MRSFGRGTFHKPDLSGVDAGSKRLFRIECGDLLFNIVFAWEGAVAIAAACDHGRVGSHRFLTCVAQPDCVKATFLRYYFLRTEGLQKLGEASPGGAGRNRTLGLNALEALEVPVPALAVQDWFDRIQTTAELLRSRRTEALMELSKLMPAMLSRAFT